MNDSREPLPLSGGDHAAMRAAGPLLAQAMGALPAAIFVTDAEGRIVFYNEAAAEMWGARPKLGIDRYCGPVRLYRPDGQPIAPQDCATARALRSGEAIAGEEALSERTDGTRIPYKAYPTPLRDENGNIVGVVSMLLDISDRRRDEIEAARLAAIVTSSQDAIVSKTLEGVVISWNEGARRIFGFTSDEMVGQLITKIIPPDLHFEERDILARIRRGERVEHFETVRVAKDGRRVDVSVTISPLRDKWGRIVGASKVGRDVTERKRAEERQQTLVNELNHRVKNTLATVQSLAAQTLRSGGVSDITQREFEDRLLALSKAHDQLTRGNWEHADFSTIVEDVFEPYRGAHSGTLQLQGERVRLNAQTALTLAMILHELATNAAKYGALSQPAGRLSVSWRLTNGSGPARLAIDWREQGGPEVTPPARRGFGSRLLERGITRELRGTARTSFDPAGFRCTMEIPV
jgi:PAS domain S-box-containing protein